MVAIRHSSCPRRNPPPTYPAVLISCVVMTACRGFAGGRRSIERDLVIAIQHGTVSKSNDEATVAD
jgi:hypothetical protein